MQASWEQSAEVKILSVAQHADGTLSVVKEYTLENETKTITEFYGAVDGLIKLLAVE